jgi:hypothetical protein
MAVFDEDRRDTLRAQGQEPAAADHFAVDLFAGGAGAAEELPAPAGGTAGALSWDEALPKVSREEARLSAKLVAAPAHSLPRPVRRSRAPPSG